MLNKSKIVAYYYAGKIDAVAHDLRMYGQIVSDTRWDETEDDGTMPGSHRVLKISHHGKSWDLHLYNGEVRELGYSLY